VARPAPAVDRALRVLRFLAAHPEESFTLSELARHLDLNKATCHAMFATMTEHGVIVRNPSTKTYSLGPTLITLADAVAPDKSRAVECVRGEMEALTEELGLASIVTGLLNDETVILARRLPNEYRAPAGRVFDLGNRQPWAPPVGPAFAAWAAPEDTQRWLDRGFTGAADRRPYYEQRLGEIRRRGYDIALASDPRTRLLKAVMLLEDQASADTRDAIRDLLDELDNDREPAEPSNSDQERLVFHITAPVFGRNSDVVITLTLDGFHKPLANRDVRAIGERLLNSTERVTQAIHGRFPADWPRRMPSSSLTRA
jgi:DNA-binding IclR family transcriptional regulator